MLDFTPTWMLAALYEKKHDTVKNICPKDGLPDIKDYRGNWI